MSERAAFDATYFTHKPIVTRKCVQLVFEVPEERLLEVLRVLQPTPGEQQVTVAIARLKETPADTLAGQDGEEKPSGMPEGVRPTSSPSVTEGGMSRRSWSSLKPSQQAAIRCGEPRFWGWLGAVGSEEAATWIRNRCGVKSRRDLDADTAAARVWGKIDSAFMQAAGLIAEAR